MFGRFTLVVANQRREHYSPADGAVLSEAVARSVDVRIVADERTSSRLSLLLGHAGRRDLYSLGLGGRHKLVMSACAGYILPQCGYIFNEANYYSVTWERCVFLGWWHRLVMSACAGYILPQCGYIFNKAHYYSVTWERCVFLGWWHRLVMFACVVYILAQCGYIFN